MKKFIGLALTTLITFGTICSCQEKNDVNGDNLFCVYNESTVKQLGKYSNGKVNLFNLDDGKETIIDFPDKEVIKIIKGYEEEKNIEWYYVKKGYICQYIKLKGKEAKINKLEFKDDYGKILNVLHFKNQIGWIFSTTKEKSIFFYHADDNGEIISAISQKLPNNYKEIVSSNNVGVFVTSQDFAIEYGLNLEYNNCTPLNSINQKLDEYVNQIIPEDIRIMAEQIYYDYIVGPEKNKKKNGSYYNQLNPKAFDNYILQLKLHPQVASQRIFTEVETIFFNEIEALQIERVNYVESEEMYNKINERIEWLEEKENELFDVVSGRVTVDQINHDLLRNDLSSFVIPNGYDKILSGISGYDDYGGIAYIKDNMFYIIADWRRKIKTKIPPTYTVPTRKNGNKKNLMDFMLHFYDIFPNAFCEHYDVEEWESADDSFMIYLNDDNEGFRVLKYDINDTSSKAILDNIKKDGGIKILGTVIPAIVNREYVLMDYKNCKEKEKIIKAFKEF